MLSKTQGQKKLRLSLISHQATMFNLCLQTWGRVMFDSSTPNMPNHSKSKGLLNFTCPYSNKVINYIIYLFTRVGGFLFPVWVLFHFGLTI